MTIWNDIPGYETRYQASTMGEIRSLDWEVGNRWNGTTPRRGRVLKPETTNRGYLRVVLCDLNGFKQINDLYGHNAGDAYLQSVAVALQTSFGGPDLDVFLLDASCDPGTGCLQAGNQTIVFEALAGAAYYLVVDGWDGEAGPFTLVVDCLGDAEGDCGNGVDDDGDGHTDCDDADCVSARECGERDCADGDHRWSCDGCADVLLFGID